jgi:RNA recognition motif-containing protein
MDNQRHGARDTMMQLQPPTRDEIVRTLFVGGITEGVGGDDGIERILRSAGNLRRWIRATDADEKPCRFGFAEYEDPESLEIAVEILKEVEVPVKRQVPRQEGEEKQEVEKSTLLVSLSSSPA